MDIEIFRSATLLVRAVGQGRGDSCVVTFSCLLDVPGLDTPGFGEAFLRDRGIDAVHVTCAGNHWFQYRDLPDALNAVRAAVRPYRRVLAYGSSMGGYAAVRYGGRAGAHEALAISPQFSIDPRRAPFDARWSAIAAGIDFLHEDAPPAVGRATVVYDPRDADARHADAIAASVPVRRIRLIHAGHPAGAYLADVGLLSELVLALCGGEAPPDIERRARAARQRSGQYLLTLSLKLSFGHFPTKLALARRAVAIDPDEPIYHSNLALLLWLLPDHPAAEAAHRRAIALSPEHPVLASRLSRFLLRRGRVQEAGRWADLAARLMPADPEVRALRIASLFARRRPVAAARALVAAPIRRDLLRPLWDDLSWLSRWQPRPDGWQKRMSDRRRPWLPLNLGGS